MADTIRGDSPKTKCSDCGEKGTVFRHWGPLVPSGVVGDFCIECWGTRQDHYLDHGIPKPIGEKRCSTISPKT